MLRDYESIQKKNTQTQDAEHVECFEVNGNSENKGKQRQINVDPRLAIDRRDEFQQPICDKEGKAHALRQ